MARSGLGKTNWTWLRNIRPKNTLIRIFHGCQGTLRKCMEEFFISTFRSFRSTSGLLGILEHQKNAKHHLLSFSVDISRSGSPYDEWSLHYLNRSTENMAVMWVCCSLCVDNEVLLLCTFFKKTWRKITWDTFFASLKQSKSS